MKWTTEGRRKVYGSEWVEVWLDQVRVTGEDPFEHHVVRMPKRTVSAVVVDGDRVLLIWRHRFITDAWGWEIPAGWVEVGESLEDAVAREVEEETGWRPGSVEPLLTYNTLSGITSLAMHTFLVSGAERIGPAADRREAARVDWVPLDRLLGLVRDGQIVDGPSLTALMYMLATTHG